MCQLDYVRVGGAKTSGGVGYNPSIFSAGTPSANAEPVEAGYNPSTTNTSTDYVIMPRIYNDPVIDYHFNKRHWNASKNLHFQDATKFLKKQNFNFDKITDDYLPTQKKLEAIEELL